MAESPSTASSGWSPPGLVARSQNRSAIAAATIRNAASAVTQSVMRRLLPTTQRTSDRDWPACSGRARGGERVRPAIAGRPASAAGHPRRPRRGPRPLPGDRPPRCRAGPLGLRFRLVLGRRLEPDPWASDLFGPAARRPLFAAGPGGLPLPAAAGGARHPAGAALPFEPDGRGARVVLARRDRCGRRADPDRADGPARRAPPAPRP